MLKRPSVDFFPYVIENKEGSVYWLTLVLFPLQKEILLFFLLCLSVSVSLSLSLSLSVCLESGSLCGSVCLSVSCCLFCPLSSVLMTKTLMSQSKR